MSPSHFHFAIPILVGSRIRTCNLYCSTPELSRKTGRGIRTHDTYTVLTTHYLNSPGYENIIASYFGAIQKPATADVIEVVLPFPFGNIFKYLRTDMIQRTCRCDRHYKGAWDITQHNCAVIFYNV